MTDWRCMNCRALIPGPIGWDEKGRPIWPRRDKTCLDCHALIDGALRWVTREVVVA